MTTSGTRWRWAAWAYTVLLTYALLTPHPLWEFGQRGRQVEETIDATLSGFTQHLAAYALLAGLMLRAYAPLTPWRAGACVLFAAAHGITAETLQQFVPHRYADVPDALANLAGVGLGTLLACGGTCLRTWQTRP